MATADRIAEISNRAFERLFARRFPGIRLEKFRFGGSDSQWMWAIYWGTPEALLRQGLVDANAVPVAPKRKCYHDCFTVEKRRKGLLRVRLHLDRHTPANHPLNTIGPLNWPYAATDEDRRQIFDLSMRERLGYVCAMIEVVQKLTTGSIAGCQFSENCRGQLDRLVHDFQNAICETTRSASIEYEFREKPFLRLVKGHSYGASAAMEVARG